MHPTEYIEGLRLFNDGHFWEAHEALERIWAPLPKRSPEKLFYQGLIQLAAAFLHRERARASPERSIRPALRCYASAMEKFRELPDVFLGLNVPDVQSQTRVCFEPLEAGITPDLWPASPRLTLE